MLSDATGVLVWYDSFYIGVSTMAAIQMVTD